MTKCIIYSKPPVLFYNKRPSVLWFEWVCLWWPENLITWQMVLGEELVFLEVSRLALFSILFILSQLTSATFDAKVKCKLSFPQCHSLRFSKSYKMWERACKQHTPCHRAVHVRMWGLLIREAKACFHVQVLGVVNVGTYIWISASQSPHDSLHSLRYLHCWCCLPSELSLSDARLNQTQIIQSSKIIFT